MNKLILSFKVPFNHLFRHANAPLSLSIRTISCAAFFTASHSTSLRENPSIPYFMGNCPILLFCVQLPSHFLGTCSQVMASSSSVSQRKTPSGPRSIMKMSVYVQANVWGRRIACFNSFLRTTNWRVERHNVCRWENREAASRHSNQPEATFTSFLLLQKSSPLPLLHFSYAFSFLLYSSFLPFCK